MLNIKRMVSVALIGLVIALVIVAQTLFTHNRAYAKASAIFNNIKDCQLSLSSNPPPIHSVSGVPVPVPKENLVNLCGDLLGAPGTLKNVTSSFTDCVNNLSSSERDQQTISFVCKNLNPP
jgi:hypothetical protein